MARVERVKQARPDDAFPDGDEARHPDRADVFVVNRVHTALYRIGRSFHVGHAGEQVFPMYGQPVARPMAFCQHATQPLLERQMQRPMSLSG